MKSTLIVNLSLVSLVALLVFTRPVPADPVTLGAFVGSSPCDAVSMSLLKIPATTNCELIKWKLTFYQDQRTLSPSSYQLTYTYGLAQQGTNGVAQGGTTVKRDGRWSIVATPQTVTGTAVYRLDPDRPHESLSFLKMGDNVIHLLDRVGKLAVGHAGWSYTLNRVGGSASKRVPPLSISGVEFEPAASTLAAPPVSSVASTFVGRSPCREVAAQLNKAVTADCMKAKWALTLYQDPIALTPTTYKLKGTFYRDRIGEGRWSIVKGTKTDPSAVIYQLDPDDSEGSLLLLKADDNILFFLDSDRNLMVGNADFSYTLNRELKARGF